MKNGLRVGIVGAVTDFVNIWEKEENLSEVRICDTYNSILEAYYEMKDKVDFTICLYHSGMECDIEKECILENTGENICNKICRDLGFDLLLTGHHPQEHLKMAIEGSKLADFINEAQLTYTGAEISCTSLANQVSGLPKKVKVRDVLLTYPFPNTLVVLEVTGETLKRALERTAEYFTMSNGKVSISERFLKPKVEHYNFDFYLGIKYKIAYNKPVGERILEIKIHGEPIQFDKTYHICMNNYRASGGGGL